MEPDTTPFFLRRDRATEDTYNASLTGAAGLSSSLVPAELGKVKPIEYFGRYNFPDAKSAAEFIQTPQFTDFWDKGNVGKKNIGVRAEVNDAGRYGSAFPRQTYADEIKDIEKTRLRRLGIYESHTAKGLTAATPEEIQKAANYRITGSRAAGRFYTQQGLPQSAVDTAFYLKPTRFTESSYPIRVIADERLSRFSLADRLPYDGVTAPAVPAGESQHQANMEFRKQRNLSRVVGKDLGASLSSNPRSEAFVSSQMATPVSQGGASRVAGRVNPDATVTLIGTPKTPVATQVANNAVAVAGKGLSYGLKGAGLYGAIESGLSVPQRHEGYYPYFRNQLGSVGGWIGAQAAAQSDAMLNFISLGGWDAINKTQNHTGTYGDYTGDASALQTPIMFEGEQSVHRDPRGLNTNSISLSEVLSRFNR